MSWNGEVEHGAWICNNVANSQHQPSYCLQTNTKCFYFCPKLDLSPAWKITCQLIAHKVIFVRIYNDTCQKLSTRNKKICYTFIMNCLKILECTTRCEAWRLFLWVAFSARDTFKSSFECARLLIHEYPSLRFARYARFWDKYIIRYKKIFDLRISQFAVCTVCTTLWDKYIKRYKKYLIYLWAKVEWGRGGMQKAGDRLPANCGGNLWGVAPWSWKTGEEAGSCAGTPHWAGGGRSCLPPVEQNGHPAAARQCCHSWEQDSNSTWGLYRWDFIIPQFTVS